jgi:hypothetical protein
MANGEDGQPAWADALERMLATAKQYGLLDRIALLNPVTGVVELHPAPPPAPPAPTEAALEIAAEKRKQTAALAEYGRQFGAAGGIRQRPTVPR